MGVAERAASSRLEIRLLGPFDARIDASPLSRLRTRKGQHLLALLALRHSREVQREWLVTALWPQSEAEQGYYNLRRTLSDLRIALGPANASITAPTPHSLRLESDDRVVIDLARFDALRLRPDAASLREAVGLYRGPLLEGWNEEWLAPDREACQEECLRMLGLLAAQAAERKDWADAARWWKRLVVIDPFHEQAHCQLMEALARDGNYAAATLVYRDFRAFLRNEINAEPAADTTALYRKLCAASHHRSESRSAPHPPIPPSSPRAPSSHIPHPLTALIGRENEVREVAIYLSKARLVTLTGTGGIGKTRLAIRVMEELAEEYAAGVWFADLSVLSDPERILQTVASLLQIRAGPDQPLIESLADLLKTRPLLLVLDNCEHLIEACARLAHRLLETCPPLRILATSRQSLGIAGEVVWRVPSLSVPDTERLPMTKDFVSQMLEYDAVRLFVNRAQLGQPAFRLDTRKARTVARLCRRLEGIPLAIEMAAAWTKMLSTEEIAARLEDRFALPAGGSRTAPARHRTLRATMDWSCELLSEAERTLLRRLSVFAGGWSLEAAETICADEDLPSRRIFDLLASLVDQSLVCCEERGGRARYLLLEIVRQYGSEQLAEQKEQAALRRLHAAWFVQFAEAAVPNLRGAEHTVWLERLEGEHDNLRAALEWCLEEENREKGKGTGEWRQPEGRALGEKKEEGQEEGSREEGRGKREEKEESQSKIENRKSKIVEGLQLAGALWRFWAVRGHPGEGREWLTRFLALSKGLAPTPVRQRALSGAGVLAYLQADYLAAYALTQESLIFAWWFGDRQNMSIELSNLGIIVLNQGHAAKARFFYQESLRIAREQEYKPAIAKALTHLGSAARAQGFYEEASALLQESLAIARELGERDGICTLLNHLGLVKQAQGRLLPAKVLFEEALAMSQELGDKRGIAWSLYNLADATWRLGGLEAALTLYRQSLLIRYDLGDRRGIAACLDQCAGIVVEQGQAACGARLWGASEALLEAMGATPSPSEAQERERQARRAQAEIGEEAFTAARTIGRTLSLEQAIALALEAAESEWSAPSS
jgi:predicted ATPase/DNA-binding SARP family transcriptional activator